MISAIRNLLKKSKQPAATTLEHTSGYKLHFHLDPELKGTLAENGIEMDHILKSKKTWFDMLFKVLDDTKTGNPNPKYGKEFDILPHRFSSDLVANPCGKSFKVEYRPKDLLFTDGKMSFPTKGALFYLMQKTKKSKKWF